MPRRRRVNRASLRALHQSLEQALAQPEEEEEDDDEADGEEDDGDEEEESGLGQRGLAVNTAFLGRLLGSLSRTNTRVERGIAEGAVANERRANLAARRRDGEARIRRIAAQHGIPIVERKPLARMLHRTVEVGDPIPPDAYAAVAEVLAYVYRMNGQAA